MSPLDLVSRIGLPVKFPRFFPPQLEAFRQSRAASSQTPDEFSVGYMLAAGGTAIGGNVTGYVKSDWGVRAGLFMVLVDYKGRGKSILADKILGPLAEHEEDLRQRALEAAEEDDDADDDADSRRRGRNSPSAQPAPCVIVNDVTGPAVLELLETSERQLLINTDELSALFGRDGGRDRQLWCELYDGRRRRKHRVRDGSRRRTLLAPHVSMIGTIQPALLSRMYNAMGDDGLVDRMLLVGVPGAALPSWPEDSDDPGLNRAWSDAIERLLNIELLAADAINGRLDVSFDGEAVAVFKRFHDDLCDLVPVLGLPVEQYGVVNKIRGHAVRLALIHRCFRWAAGEFGTDGPLGNIDETDARAARDAAAFFLGRWIIWRPELAPSAVNFQPEAGDLLQDPGEDPVLRSLATAAIDARHGLRLIERLVRHIRRQKTGPVSLACLSVSGPLATVPLSDLRLACGWLVDNGHAAWVDGEDSIRLEPIHRRGGLRGGEANNAATAMRHGLEAASDTTAVTPTE